ncbi:MAG: Lrp/AsnC family transcriptional regulator [Candidatus Methanofastidiosia archaeon]
MIFDEDLKLLRELQNIPITERPFKVIGEKLSISESEVLEKARKLLEKRYIRRFAASINHREVGILHNAMVLCKVRNVDVVGEKVAFHREVTHCYQRDGFEYNLFYMIHSKKRSKCFEMAERIAKNCGISDYLLLFSEKEFKKTSFLLR